MKFIRIQGAPHQIAALRADYQREFGAAVIVTNSEPSEEIQDLLSTSAVIGLIPSEVGDGYMPGIPERLDAAHPQALKHLHQAVGQTDIVDRLHEGLFRLIRYSGHIGSSLIHNFQVAAKSVERYREITGAYPQSVCEAGFGSDCTGQILFCLLHGIRFSGVSAQPGKGFAGWDQLQEILQYLRTPLDVRSCVGSVIHKTEFAAQHAPGPYDLVYSHVVYEHVTDPRGFTTQIVQCLRPDGYLVCDVDFTGHGYGDHPLAFLRLSDAQFGEGVNQVANRMKYEDYLTMFADLGLQVVRAERSLPLDVPSDIAASFPEYTLGYGMCEFACRKLATDVRTR